MRAAKLHVENRPVSRFLLGPVDSNDIPLVVHAALVGLGLAFLGEDLAAPYQADSRLIRVSELWCQSYPGFFL